MCAPTYRHARAERGTESIIGAEHSPDPRVRAATLATYAVFLTIGVAVAKLHREDPADPDTPRA